MSKEKTNDINMNFNLHGIQLFVRRYGTLIYLVLTAIVLATALFIVMQLIVSGDTNENAANSYTNFDQETIDLLKEDARTAEQNDVSLPQGRINPFE